MAAHMRMVAVRIEYLDHTEGLWCNTCMLGTGIRMWVAVISRTGMHLQPRLWCYEHEGSRGVVDEPTGA
jgi:hypothetical protein